MPGPVDGDLGDLLHQGGQPDRDHPRRPCEGAAGPTGAAPELNRAKGFTRVGMGRCQGRVCGAAAAEVLAGELGCDVAAIGRLRGQPPVKPIPIAAPAEVA